MNQFELELNTEHRAFIAFMNEDYTKAINLWQHLLSYDTLNKRMKKDAYKHLAFCHLRLEQYEQAHSRFINSMSITNDPIEKQRCKVMSEVVNRIIEER